MIATTISITMLPSIIALSRIQTQRKVPKFRCLNISYLFKSDWTVGCYRVALKKYSGGGGGGGGGGGQSVIFDSEKNL